MARYIERGAGEIAALIAREGLDYLQTKAVFKAARRMAGLTAPKPRRGAPARLSLEEELRFIDHAYAHSGPVGLMMQTLLETGTRVSEFVALRIEDVSLAERIVTITAGKGGKRREVPIRLELARLLALHIGKRRAGPLFPSREKGAGPYPHVYSRQRIGQMVREVADAAGITKRLYPHLLRHIMATRLLALGLDITDVQRFLGHDDIATTGNYAETSAATLRRKFDQVTAPGGRVLVQVIAANHGAPAAAFAADLLGGSRQSC
ncbi:tyrosine-type recombinase/integrase [Azospirillum sp. RWY-5-1]|uniref:Tyrosine-type recombinase/integrase n=1 Tax=Azospirillum oleiclasticum TaxID=2735135 RepID=A0ABX2TJG2_9PROT|nr:tyrosine-type recombinase/integrase [Azospirillum oleiclasticum]NYZ14346.1 tyrosine-type recombinase/integrase [Azospirillum oleiclasticum]NYZ23302.1 tyrosine-type recombinase/integrase [Azospirillum oleiclasticum]